MRKITPFQNEPLIDWSLKENREKMRRALVGARKYLGKIYPNLIGDRYISCGKTFPSLNPADHKEVVGYLSSASEDTIRRATKTALVAWQSWKRIQYYKRVEIMLHAANIMRRRRFEFAALVVLETGKNWQEADGDVAEAIDYLEYYGRQMLELGEPQVTQEVPGERNYTLYIPRGVVGVIGVWNFPFAIPMDRISAALVTGNTVVFKPSPYSSVIGFRIAEIYREAGVPEGVFNLVFGDKVEGRMLMGDSNIIHRRFTGSAEVLREIQRITALAEVDGFGEVKGESGGKGKIIIDKDADLPEAVRGVMASAFEGAGQKCSAGSVNIVLEDVADEFLERLVEATRSISIGSPEEPETLMGPLISQSQLEKVRKYVEIGKREAGLAYEGVVPPEFAGKGYYHAPVIFVDADVRSRIYQEEIFGPVLTVVKAKNLDQAIQFFNNSRYALTGGIFSRLPSNIERAVKECECGNFYVNRKITGALVGRHPFGGYKLSGTGSKAGSKDYLKEFMYERTVSENRMRHGAMV